MQNQGDKETALTHNIRAVKAITDTVKSTLGPKGMDKLMMDMGGDTIVTNDGATILQEADVSHPVAKMIVDAADTQESMCYDGTTSIVVLAGQLLSNSEGLTAKGIHPNTIREGYAQAARWAVEYLEEMAVDAGDHLHDVARTSVTGKALASSMEYVTDLTVKTVEGVQGEHDRIRVLCQPGGGLDDSYCFNGVILHKEFLIPSTSESAYNNIVLVNTGMDMQKMEDNMQVQFSSAQEFQSYRQQVNRDDWVAKADAIAEHLPDGGVVVVRDNVNEIVASMLSRKGIAVVQRVPESDMVALGHLCGISPAHTPEDITMIGTMAVEQKTIGDMNYVIIEGEDESPVITLVLRGATRQTLDETERGFADALGVVSIAYKSGKVVSGGGSTYMAMARHLRERATEIGGRAQMAVDAFAEGLESIPATIAENAGHVPLLDTVLSLRGAHEVDNHYWGPDITGPSGTICDMAVLGVWEPLDLVRQVVLSATEVSTSILRIDDIMAKKSDGAPPQQSGFGMQQV